MAPAVVVEQLRITYGRLVAVDGVSFTVEEGEIFGLLGPNGAGKTSTLEAAEGLRRPAAGRIRVLGFDPFTQRRLMHHHIGVQLQETSFPDQLRVEELCRLFASFYKDPAPYAELLEELGLAEKRRAFISDLSGGQRQRLALLLALIPRPRVAFLDEITTGLDPHARRRVWQIVRDLKARGTAVILATHLMDEAQELCDRVAIMRRGRIVALDTPARLIEACAQGTTRVVFDAPASFEERVLLTVEGITDVERVGSRVVVRGRTPHLLELVAGCLRQHGHGADTLASRPYTLEDAFLQLTGTRLTPEGEEEQPHETVA